MRVVKKILSLLLALTILTPAGAPAAYAETGTEGASAQAGSEAIAAAETAEGIEPGGTAEDASSAAEGAEAGTADEAGEEASSEEKEQPEMTEDGHIDGEKLKLWLENYLAADHWDEPQCSISIAFWYSGSEETWLYNPDEWMYGVNWSKLPISMVYAEKLANGELSPAGQATLRCSSTWGATPCRTALNWYRSTPGCRRTITLTTSIRVVITRRASCTK